MACETDGGTTFSVVGGPGSISYTLAEIAGAGTGMARQAQLMEPLLDRMQSEAVWLADAAQASAEYPYGALDSMQHALWRGRQAHMQAVNLVQKLAHASEGYAAAEDRAAAMSAPAGRLAALQAGLAAWSWGPLASLKFLADATAWMRQTRDEGLRDGVEDLLNNGAAYAAGAAGPLAGMSYWGSQMAPGKAADPGVLPAMVLRGFFDGAGLTRPGRVAMRAVPAEEWNPGAKQWPQGHATSDPIEGEAVEIRATIADVLAETQAAYDYPPGSIGVLEVVRPDGTAAWVVNLPGTEDWSTIDSTNPFDMEGNVEGLTAAHKEIYRQKHVVVQELIKQALAASGALPNDEVLITGHSGGGIHAAAAAADPQFLEEVNVKMIVVAGAPIKNLDVAEQVASLGLENEHDIVTATDYGTPVGTANRVTVTSHRPVVAGISDVKTLVAEAHSMANYVSDAVALDSSNDPAVLASRAELAALLGVGVGGAVAGRKFVYQGKDVADRPQNGGRTGASVPKKGAPGASEQRRRVPPEPP